MGLVRQGEIWLCALDPTVGSEIRKTRPCLIVSPDLLNSRLQTVIVAPMTSKGRPAPFRVATSFDDVQGLIVVDQLRALDRRRLRKRLGIIADADLAAVLAILGEIFAKPL